MSTHTTAAPNASIPLTLDELQEDVVIGLVEQGYKRGDANAAVALCRGTDFESIFREAIERIRNARASGRPLVPAALKATQPTTDEATCPRCHSPRHRGKCKGANVNPALRADEPVTLQQIAEEIEGAPVFTNWSGVDVRYPTVAEVQSRCRPGPKDGQAVAITKLSEESPTGCSEFKLIPGVSLQSYASRIGGHLRKYSKIKFSVYQDRKTKTIIVRRRTPLQMGAAAGGSRA